MSEDEIIRECLDRKPSPYAKLFLPLGGPGYVQIDWSARSLDAYAEAYFEAARGYLRNLPKPCFDYHIVPIVFLFRHSVELYLKDCLRNSLALARTLDPEFPDPKAARKVLTAHRLSVLLAELKRMVIHNNEKSTGGGCWTVEWISAQAEEFIGELDEMDPESICFRYPTDTKGQAALQEGVGFNLEALGAGMTHIQRELSHLRDIVAIADDQLGEYLEDLRSEIGWPY